MKLPSPRESLLLLCLPLLAGCNDPFSPRDELNDARRRWQSQGLTTYAYAITRSCECQIEYTRKAWVQVVNGTVTAAHFFPDFTPVPPTLLPGYPTIDALFDMIDNALDRDAPRLVVEYDRDLGYPTLFDVDYHSQMVDDELVVRVSDLTTVFDMPGSP